MGVIQQSLILFTSAVPLFAMCLTFEELTGRFDAFDFYQQCDWYKCPSNNVKRALPFIIANTQRSIVFNGYGDFALNRETCIMVITGINSKVLSQFYCDTFINLI